MGGTMKTKDYAEILKAYPKNCRITVCTLIAVSQDTIGVFNGMETKVSDVLRAIRLCEDSHVPELVNVLLMIGCARPGQEEKLDKLISTVCQYALGVHTILCEEMSHH